MQSRLFSTMLNWTIRCLAIFVIFICIILFMLNTLAGNGDAQRNGLQQAFSDGLGVPVTIGRLNKFNAIPQFHIDIQNFMAGSPNGDTYLQAEQFIVAFSLLDILFNKKTIQELKITNAEFKIPQISKQNFKNTTIQILQPELTKPARLFLTGLVNDKPIELSLTMQHDISNLNYNYSLSNKEIITAKSGACEITGTFDQSAPDPFTWNLPAALNDDCAALIALVQ